MKGGNKMLKGGVGAADWMIGSAGDMSQQTAANGTNMLQYKPVSCMGGGGSRRRRAKKGGMLVNDLAVPQAYLIISQTTRKSFRPKKGKKHNKSKRRH
jgi:hypothetical protein